MSIWAALTAALTTQAQSVTTIYSFVDGPANPGAGLTVAPDGNFYGTTEGDGSSGLGTVFRVTTNGTLTTLVNFNITNGANPFAGLILGPDGSLYGTTLGETGAANTGTVFKMTTNGTLTTLVSFNDSDGAYPYAGLTLGPDGNFYGTTYIGGFSDDGTVLKMTTNGALMTLVNFNDSNGADPYAGLTLGPDGNFFGTTVFGGSSGVGTVFKLSPNGALTTLVNFKVTNGANPYANLTMGPDGNLYGTTSEGGVYSYGTLFKVTTNGTLTTLVTFNLLNGANPYASLTLGPDGNLYGTSYGGGTGNGGTVFKVTTNGTLMTLVSFNVTNGANPQAGLTLGPGGNFYGTTYNGGSAGQGTIFQLNLPPDFITPPANQTVASGGSTTFGSQVFGTAPFAYQWLSNGVPIAGATNATLSFSLASAADAAGYQLVVTNSYGSIASQVVSLNVLSQPSIYAIFNSGRGTFKLYLASKPNSTNRLWATTNLALPFAQWQSISTNVTDSSGLSQFMDANTAGVPQKFYRLSYP